MRADSVYKSPRMAAGHAFSRPAVRPHIITRIREHLRIERPVACALDIGCGAGRSTAALEPIARRAVGLEPVQGRLAHWRHVLFDAYVAYVRR